MTRLSPLLVLWAGLFLMSPRSAFSAQLVRLDRWDGRASLVPNPGPGEQDFSLAAEVAWARSAPRGAPSYATRVSLPDGRVLTRRLDAGEGPGSSYIKFAIPAAAVRNLRPEAVVVRAWVVTAADEQPVSNELRATIADFPTANPGGPPPDRGPFGWGQALGDAKVAAALPRRAPDGSAFVRIPGSAAGGSLYLAATEATNAQVAAKLNGYDPAAGRSDEFALEAPGQPALGLTPERATAYLAALTAADATGITYRLPTRDEWLRAARAGRPTAFWWGDEPKYVEGANLLGPEPALLADSTAPSQPGDTSPAFRPNPWGLAHTFGNIAEWAVTEAGGHVRMGGHFRTEPANPLGEVEVADPKQLGPDPYVGVRPAFSLSREQAPTVLEKTLHADPSLARVKVAYDEARDTAVLTGEVTGPDLVRQADRRLAGIWWLAAVENRMTTPTVATGQLVQLGPKAGPTRRLRPLGRVVDVVPIAARWADVMPVDGSEWWVNVYSPGGAHVAHVLAGARPGLSPSVDALLDRPKVADGPVSIALSLGAPAPSPADPRVVSNVLSLDPSAR